jgi:serine/threonine protein phosphatase 1
LESAIPATEQKGPTTMDEVSQKSDRTWRGRTVAVGDVHGCATALAALIAAVGPGPEDVIVTLGDYIDRGPDSRGVIEQLLALAGRRQLVPLVGNHEDMLLAVLERRSDRASWQRFGGDETLKSYGGEDLKAIPDTHLDFFKASQRYYETDSHIFAHANYWPNLPMGEQPSNALLWEHVQPDKAYPHYSGKPVVVGHTPQKDGDILDLGFLICIDTNCCEGGWLTALDVGSGHYWQTNDQGEMWQGRLRRRRP